MIDIHRQLMNHCVVVGRLLLACCETFLPVLAMSSGKVSFEKEKTRRKFSEAVREKGRGKRKSKLKKTFPSLHNISPIFIPQRHSHLECAGMCFAVAPKRERFFIIPHFSPLLSFSISPQIVFMLCHSCQTRRCCFIIPSLYMGTTCFFGPDNSKLRCRIESRSDDKVATTGQSHTRKLHNSADFFAAFIVGTLQV